MNTQQPTNQMHDSNEEARMKWYMIYFVTGLSTVLIAIILTTFIITRSPLTFTGLSIPSGLLLQILRHLFPTKRG